MKEIISIGPIHIYFFGMMIAIGMVIAGAFAIKQAEKRGINEDTILNVILLVVTSGIIGARLFYILFYNPAFYFNNPSQIFKIYEGGLSIHGGIFTAILVGYLYCKKRKISFFKMADIIAMALPLAQGIGRVGCDVFGKPMINPLPWGINYGGILVHPAQVYEFVLDYILFIFLWRRSYKQKFEGELFVIYLISFSIIRGIVEFFRINPVIWGPFSISHLLSLGLIVIGLILYNFLLKRNTKKLDGISGEQIKLLPSIVLLVTLIIISMIIFYTVQG